MRSCTIPSIASEIVEAIRSPSVGIGLETDSTQSGAFLLAISVTARRRWTSKPTISATKKRITKKTPITISGFDDNM
jgi:hypothetical protein